MQRIAYHVLCAAFALVDQLHLLLALLVNM